VHSIQKQFDAQSLNIIDVSTAFSPYSRIHLSSRDLQLQLHVSHIVTLCRALARSLIDQKVTCFVFAYSFNMKLFLCILPLVVKLCQANPSLSLSARSTGCCPNGIFTDDLANACQPGNPLYGDGQCYGQYQINCQFGYNSYFSAPEMFLAVGTVRTYPYDTYNLETCLNFCRGYGGQFMSATLNIKPYLGENNDPPGWQIGCGCRAEEAEIFITGFTEISDYRSLIYCPTGPPAPPLACCEQYNDDLSKLCKGTDSDPDQSYGNDKCLPGGFKVRTYNILRLDIN
jgi:hypothetical protein